jgi:hypothetical protein
MIVGTRESSNPRIHPFIKMILDLEKFVQNHAAAKMNINETNWAIRELKSPIRTNVVNMAFSSALKKSRRNQGKHLQKCCTGKNDRCRVQQSSPPC